MDFLTQILLALICFVEIRGLLSRKRLEKALTANIDVVITSKEMADGIISLMNKGSLISMAGVVLIIFLVATSQAISLTSASAILIKILASLAVILTGVNGYTASRLKNRLKEALVKRKGGSNVGRG